MKAGILLSVRAKATRLPDKVLKPLAGAPTVTEHLLRRLATAAEAAVVVLATSPDPRDDVLVYIAARVGLPAFRGSADDKLMRYRDAAITHGLDFVVVVDGDDPFVSVEHIDRLIRHACAAEGDYFVFEGLPLGAAGFGLRTSALRVVCADRAESNTEVWGRFFADDPRFHCVRLAETDPRYARPDIRMTLDYPEDYVFFAAVAEGLAREGRDTSFGNIMDFLSRRPDVIAINQGVQEIYEQHLLKSAS